MQDALRVKTGFETGWFHVVVAVHTVAMYQSACLRLENAVRDSFNLVLAAAGIVGLVYPSMACGFAALAAGFATDTFIGLPAVRLYEHEVRLLNSPSNLKIQDEDSDII